MVLRIIGQLERGNDDFCQCLFPSELINRAFEIIQPISWRVMLPDFLVDFAAMAWVSMPFSSSFQLLFNASAGALNVAGGTGGSYGEYNQTLVEAMVPSIIGRLERGDDDFCQFLFPSVLINWAFEPWRGWTLLLPKLNRSESQFFSNLLGLFFRRLTLRLVEAMVVSIIGRLERGDDDLCPFLFPSELINRAFEPWRGWTLILLELKHMSEPQFTELHYCKKPNNPLLVEAMVVSIIGRLERGNDDFCQFLFTYDGLIRHLRLSIRILAGHATSISGGFCSHALNAAGGTGRNDGGESNQCKNLNSLFINLTEGVLLRVSYPFMLCMLMPSILSFVNASAGPLNFGGVRGEACSQIFWLFLHPWHCWTLFSPDLKTDLSLYVSLKNISVFRVCLLGDWLAVRVIQVVVSIIDDLKEANEDLPWHHQTLFARAYYISEPHFLSVMVLPGCFELPLSALANNFSITVNISNSPFFALQDFALLDYRAVSKKEEA
uniref:Uncharacterized protein n=1 Tax=Solanum lycopersicum TaxID=4081 RepID=A0A3Q7H2I1_SOLLC